MMFRDLLPSLYRRRRTGGENLPEQRGRGPEDDFFGVMEDFFRPSWQGRVFPAVDLSEEGGEVVVSAELPGLEPKDVELSLEHGNLVIKGEKRYEHKGDKDGRAWSERGYGSFHRVIPLPGDVKEEGVKADYKNGVLTVRLPMDEASRPRKIAIQG